TRSAVRSRTRAGSMQDPGARLRLLRGGRERRQLAHVARVVLNDDRGLEICRELLEAVDRREALRATGVEPRHTVVLPVLVKMHEVARDQHVALLLQLDEQGVVPWRVPG